MAEPTGLEPATSDVTGRRSNQLNYDSALRTFNDGSGQTWWAVLGSNQWPPVCKSWASRLPQTTKDEYRRTHKTFARKLYKKVYRSLPKSAGDCRQDCRRTCRFSNCAITGLEASYEAICWEKWLKQHWHLTLSSPTRVFLCSFTLDNQVGPRWWITRVQQFSQYVSRDIERNVREDFIGITGKLKLQHISIYYFDILNPS